MSLCLHLQACQLPLFSYIVERLCACCYEQAWYAKLGGVVSIKFLMERLPLIWVLQNQLTFLKALLFVMMDLTGEVKSQFLLLRRKKKSQKQINLFNFKNATASRNLRRVSE